MNILLNTDVLVVTRDEGLLKAMQNTWFFKMGLGVLYCV